MKREFVSLIKTFDRRADGDVLCVALLGTSPGEGVSSVVADIAAGLREGNRRVAVLDFSLVGEQIKSEGKTHDLGKLLSDGSGSIPTDDFMVARLAPEEASSPSFRLTTTQVQTLVQRLKTTYHFILFDLPPVLTNDTYETVLPCVDRYYLVVRQAQTTEHRLLRALERLRRNNADPEGVIYNGRQRTIPNFVYGVLFGGRRG